MKRYFTLLFCLVISILGFAQTPVVRFYFDDNAKSSSDTFNLTIKADLSNPDYLKIDSMTVEYIKIKSFKNYDFTQQVFSQAFVPYGCTVTQIEETYDNFGNTIQLLSLKDITNEYFGFDVNYSIATIASFKGFSDCSFNAGIVKSLPDSITQYLVATDLIQKDNDTLVKLALQITKGCTTTNQMVDSMVKWLSTNISYDFTFNHSRQDAMSVIRYKTALCEGYSNLMCAMLRSLGVAARKVDGYLTSVPVHYSIYGYQESNSSTAGGHSWVEVYYPPLHSWVSTEPQMDPNVIFGNYIVFNNGVQALVKQMSFYAGSQISSGSATFSVGTVTSDTVYSTNLSSTNAEPHTATSYNVAIALNVKSGITTPTPILKDTAKTICDNSTILPTFIVTNPQGTVTWIQNGQTIIGDTLIPSKPDSSVNIYVYQTQSGCVSETVKAVFSVLKQPTAPVLESGSLMGCCYSPVLSARNVLRNDSIQWFFNDKPFMPTNVYFISFQPQSIGYYKFVATDSLGCYTQTSNTVNITELDVPLLSKNAFKIYPNPTKGLVSLLGESVLSYIITVYNNQGIVIQTIQNSTGNLAIDLSQYPAGIYSVVVRNGNGQWSSSVVKE